MNGCSWKSAPQWQIYPREVNIKFLLNLLVSKILLRRFCYVTGLARVSVTVFFSQASSEMLSFLHRRDCCWQCEFDTDAIIELKIIITRMENNHVFIKKYISKQRAKGTMFSQSLYCNKWRIPPILKRTLNLIFNMEKVDLDEP